MNLKAFSKRLSTLMKRTDIKRAELAHQLEVKVHALDKWKYAQRQPPRPIVIQLIEQFLSHLTPEQADGWATEAGYRLTSTERHTLFFSRPTQSSPPPNPQAIYRRLPTRLGKLFGIEQTKKTLLAKLMDPTDYWLMGIDGLGGLGKTALATSLVHTLLQTARFYQVAWVSAKQREYSAKKGLHPVTSDPALSQEELINQLLNQLHPTLSPMLPPQEKLSLLQRWFKQQPYLIVVDNLETIDDYEALLELVGRLSNPSKFLLTCRLNLAVETGIYNHSLKPLDKRSVYELLWYAGEQRHRLLAEATTDMLDKIYEVVGGNPLALNLVVGQLQTMGLDDLIDRLQQAKGKKENELYHHIYWDSWQDLDESARQVLRILTVMEGEPMTDEEISWADNSCPKLNELERQAALESLHSFSLLIKQGDLAEPTYTIHRLTESFLMQKVFKWQEDSDASAEDR